ncbi:MAG: hypothetical protein KDK25_01825 [Leptospiraceae bacterium]|nr:hypothetical protein [Leptospiraceae bacterium]
MNREMGMLGSQRTAQDIVAGGYRSVNFIRMGLAFLFGGAIVATGLNSFHRTLIQAEAAACIIFLLVSVIGLILMRGGRIPERFSRAAVFIDMTILGVTMIVVCLDSQQEAYMMVRNTTIYAVYYIILGYSTLLGSASLTLFLSVWGGLLYGGSMYVAALTGVDFGAMNDYTINQASIPDAIILALYLPVAGAIVAGTLRIQKGLISVSTEHASTNAELVASLTDQKHVLAMHARDLDNTTVSFKEFVEQTTARIESQAAALEQANAVTEELTASATQTSDIVQHQSKGIEAMAESSTELNALINEISASNQDLITSARDSVMSMEKVLAAVQGTTEILGRLEDAFKNVSQITEVMTEIADKTNLLSLNASIEAARAGDAGRGFAVVANEVSKLADFTGQNVRQIAQIVSDSMTTIDEARNQSQDASNQANHQKEQTNQTNEQVEKTSELLRRQASILQGLVKELEVQRGRAGEVMNSSREQIDGQKELARTMESLDREITQINDSAKELSEGIERISNQAAELSRISQSTG